MSYDGQSRSRAVGAFAEWLLDGDNSVYFKEHNLNEYVYDILMQTVPYVLEDSEEDSKEDIAVSWNPFYELDMSEEVLTEIVYTGTEFKEACHNIEKFCQSVPASGFWTRYLDMAEQLGALYGEILSIMEEERTENNEKKVAVCAREIDRIVNR